MDADLSHNPHTIPRLVSHLSDYDVVIGSRYIKNGMIEKSLIFKFLGHFRASILWVFPTTACVAAGMRKSTRCTVRTTFGIEINTDSIAVCVG